jgi:hypothetical protein
MSDDRDAVRALAGRLFPESVVAAVMEVLQAYGAKRPVSERARVQLAILKLSEGQQSKLRHYVEVAERDFRDVLYWAESSTTPMASLLEVLRASWSWVLVQPTRVLARNRFGNVLVELGDASVWRVCPEDLTATEVATSVAALDTLWADEEFQTDWAVEAWIEAAESALGPLGENQCYGFKVWPVLGAPYEVENMVIKPVSEWLAVSGDVGRQVKDLPPGTQIRLDTGGA